MPKTKQYEYNLTSAEILNKHGLKQHTEYDDFLLGALGFVFFQRKLWREQFDMSKYSHLDVVVIDGRNDPLGYQLPPGMLAPQPQFYVDFGKLLIDAMHHNPIKFTQQQIAFWIYLSNLGATEKTKNHPFFQKSCSMQHRTLLKKPELRDPHLYIQEETDHELACYEDEKNAEIDSLSNEIEFHTSYCDSASLMLFDACRRFNGTNMSMKKSDNPAAAVTAFNTCNNEAKRHSLKPGGMY